MPLVIADRVQQTSVTAGTGTLTLNGTVTGYQSFAAVGDGNTTYYTIFDPNTSEWEVGIGTYTASGTTLSRTTVLSSSNAGALVTFASNTKSVFCTYSGAKAVYEDASDNVNIGTSGVAARLYVSGNAAQNIAALTDAATIAVDMSAANNFSVTLGGSRTLGNPTGLIAGQSGVIFITQDGTGSKTLAYSSFWDFSQGVAPTLTTTANAVDALVYSVRTSTAIVATLITNVG